MTRAAHQGHDLDFIVPSGAIVFARAFAKKVRGAFILLDKESGCARVAKKIAGELWTYDFADLRAKDLSGDINKRDFTINTFVVDLMALGPGRPILSACRKNPRALADIASKTIRMTSAAAFDDDPLRLLRAYSLSAQTGFKVEAQTLAAITPRVRLIRNASAERVREELFKIFESPRAAATIKAMAHSGLLFAVIPQLKFMDRTGQDLAFSRAVITAQGTRSAVADDSLDRDNHDLFHQHIAVIELPDKMRRDAMAAQIFEHTRGNGVIHHAFLIDDALLLSVTRGRIILKMLDHEIRAFRSVKDLGLAFVEFLFLLHKIFLRKILCS
ncbi:MAG: hypothetical protein HQL18_05250, partial [Candidatus Omnitrophica bacterium]|nr:hypothetical protein [Candidatus Omnitrophota bacterium]